MSQPLNGKVALVTGGSRGIGEGIARRLAREGAAVAVTYNASADRAEALVKEIVADGGQALALQADAADRASVRTAVTEVAERFGRLDILVNNAGTGIMRPLEELTDADYDHVVAVNLRGVFAATQEALRHIGDGGRIITIGSINADRVPFEGGSLYALTKAGVAGFTRALAREVGRRGITVNNVQPGPVDTDMNPADGPWAAAAMPHLAVGRYGTADEVAGLVAHLAGPDAAYITGASLDVDGGYAA
ncbi:short-chain dehydrogenase/reductase family oxidoreductase [Streptomyces himastatinicus ATCC 53653]|uniref:Short-chain dehydrogenase/reductase family oxidoreductase n=1 Tax=Streptomyces himastatinicus ATCC 53653 TaxID=457427 RepID=D9WG81_9ACTN|nr:3-oxoacyl-ACP reductase family protein [Streptomyces himastatinicus]EFL23298.1 short-chain dehydrogenase/reductase family oxidoreductase [Streptomyces himastatinicus ATCC 53653]